ncbi:receptor-like protein kinase, partial [Trifolium pratense]
DLSRNQLSCDIPTSMVDLNFLAILNLSYNTLSGKIPIGTLLQAFDGSSYEGIPVEMAKLVELISLNLSRNQLVGSIPSNIGELKNLDTLDLSWNHLSCAIPTSMANMDRLAVLDLSYNTLSGKIPIGTELQTLSGFCFEGNSHLCGEPLEKACPRNSWFKDAHCSHSEEHENDSNHEDKGMDMEINPFYISMGIGFSTGFWVFWGSLILIASWRHAYFRFLSNMNDRIYVTVVVAYNKLRRKLHAQQPPM